MTVESGRRVTSVDVAREAGLSRTTVSFVLNDTPHQQIPEETRQRVFAAAARLGYSPSAAARSLRSGRTDVILCLLPDWPIGPNVTSLLEHISTGFAEYGLTFVTHPRAGAVQPLIEIWKNITPAAVLAFEDIDADVQAAMRSAGTKVTVAPLGDGRGRYSSSIAQHRDGRLQVEHLAAVGHRHLGYAQTHDDRVGTFSVPRLAGARQACAELELDEPVVRTVSLDIASASSAVQYWRSRTPAVTAVCAYNDDVALALLLALHSLGLTAPADLAIIGVDNTQYAALADLTTVASYPELMARYLVQATMCTLQGKKPPRRPSSTTAELIRRGST